MESPAFQHKEGHGGLENPNFVPENNRVGDSSQNGVDGLRHRIPSKDPSHFNGTLPTPTTRRSRKDMNFLSRGIEGTRSFIFNNITENKTFFKNLLSVALFLGYNAYVVAAVAYGVRHEEPISWCDGLGFLIIITGILYWSLFYYLILKGYFGEAINNNILKPLHKAISKLFSNPWVSRVLGLLVIAGVVTFIVIDSWDSPRRLISAGGYLVLIMIVLLLSKHPGDVNWRQVLGGLALQFIFALLVLRWQGGRNVVECVADKVTKFLGYANEGSAFVYNFASSGRMEVSGLIPKNGSEDLLTKLNLTKDDFPFNLIIPTTFAFTSLSVILFFSFVVQLLYHIGAMLWVVRKMGWLLQHLVGTSAAESMNAAANIFLGQTEAPLLIKPFMDDLTKSELHAVMTGGFATIAGTVMAAYIGFGVKAESLLTASVMAAPCALALSKLMYPEVEESKTTLKHLKEVETKSEGNALDAAAKGAVEGVTLVGCILANILAVYSFVAFLNGVLSWFGALVGLPELTFQWVLSKIFIPVALLLGVHPNEAEAVGELLGLKIVVNEFVAYQKLQEFVGEKVLSTRSVRLAEYALCGFANFSSMGIQLGGLGALAPDRRPELAQIVWRALFAGATASLMNACVAGTLMSFDDEIDTTTNSTMTTLSSLIL